MMILYECLSYPNGLMTIIIINGGEMQLNLFLPHVSTINFIPYRKYHYYFLLPSLSSVQKPLFGIAFLRIAALIFCKFHYFSKQTKKITHILTSDWKEAYLKKPQQWFERISSTSCLSIQIKTKKWSGKWGETILSFGICLVKSDHIISRITYCKVVI